MTPAPTVTTAPAATVDSTVDFSDVPGAADVTVLACTTDDQGRRWLILEERRLSLLLVDADVAENTDWVLSPEMAGQR